MVHDPQLMGDIMSNLYWLTEAQMERFGRTFQRAEVVLVWMTVVF
jgi:hypothetical protein